MGAIHSHVLRCQFEPQGYRLQRVVWIYVVNHYALLQYIINVKAIRVMVSEDFFKDFPHNNFKEVNDRPLEHGQVGPQRHSCTIQNIAYTKYINYGPYIKYF